MMLRTCILKICRDHIQIPSLKNKKPPKTPKNHQFIILQEIERNKIANFLITQGFLFKYEIYLQCRIITRKVFLLFPNNEVISSSRCTLTLVGKF